MTERQKRFADEYLKDLDPVRAYKTAYPNVTKDKTAWNNSHRLRKNAEVEAYIEEHLKEIHSSNIASAEEILAYLTSVVRGKSESQIVVIEGQGEGISTARHVMKNPDEKEKLKAAELMSKYHNLLTPKVEISGKESGVIMMTPVLPDG